MFLLIAIYLMKFATDVLGMSAAVMGTILFLGRGIWDAVADPIAGYLSDRTNTRLGRRRPWLLASARAVGDSPSCCSGRRRAARARPRRPCG